MLLSYGGVRSEIVGEIYRRRTRYAHRVVLEDGLLLAYQLLTVCNHLLQKHDCGMDSWFAGSIESMGYVAGEAE